MDIELTSEQKERIWQHRLHLDTMYNNRLNFFLVSESILIAIVGSLKDRSEINGSALIAIIIFGLLLTIIWIYVQAKQGYLLNLAKSKCMECMEEYKAYKEDETRKKYWVSITWLLTYGVPSMVAGIWISLLFIIR